MRKLLMMAGAAAIALSTPAVAKPDKGGGKGGGGGHKAEHSHKPEKGHGGGHGGGWKAGKPHKEDRGWARREFKAERRFEKREFKAEKNWAKAEQKREKQWRKAEVKADKQWAKQERRYREDDRRFRGDDRRYRAADQRYDDDRRFAGDFDGGCPPGLARKNNGCLPPGQAKKRFGIGEFVPAGYFAAYNLPDEYRNRYYDNPEYSYRYDDGDIYRVDNGTNLVSALIPLLGGGFSVGNVLPAGYDIYNLPVTYRDDYQDNGDALYRYGDDAIYQVDPHSQMIEAVVALLAGDLNVGQLLPSGYDAYNLPMDYRDRYQDSDEAMYRYADGNIYEVDPQTRMIEAIVAQLV